MDMLEGMRSFCQVVEAGGFAAAARKMGVSRAVVNKRVRKLEEALGAQLLRRSTRKVSPTDTGLAFYQRCLAVITEFDAAVGAVSELQENPVGTLRINAPMSFGTLHLGDIIARFMSAYPKLQVEVSLNDRFVDPIEEGFDVSLRVSEPAYSTSLVTREITRMQMLLCASPAYLEAHGEPRRPADLAQHRLLYYGYQASGVYWRLSGPDGKPQTVSIEPAMRSNNGEILAAAARGGQGIALLPTFIAGAALQSGELRSLMCDFQPAPLTLCALYPRHQHLSGKVRLFVDFVADAIGEYPYWDLVT